jgi:hypothetical protein
MGLDLTAFDSVETLGVYTAYYLYWFRVVTLI